MTAPVIRLNEAQAGITCRYLSWDVQSAMESNMELDSAADALAFWDTAEPIVKVIRDLSESRETEEVAHVREISKRLMDELQHSVGYESVNLEKVRKGDPECIGEEGQEKAEAVSEKSITEITREAALLREVFEMARRIVGAGPLRAEEGCR